MTSPAIRIGTRESELALWQAHNVEKMLQDLGHKTKIVAIKSDGDINLDKPLYELGITGIFTKTLDIAMLKGQIDIAVHSMKDVPTHLPKGIMQAAVLERGSPCDILVYNLNLDFLNQNAVIATGSLRRQAMWLNKYPSHKVVGLRGNINTRLQKLNENNWNGAIFASAGLDRIKLKPKNSITLDWMIPAPAQGATVILAMQNNPYCINILSQLNHFETYICTHLERQFLQTLEGGCTAPIGALAQIMNDKISFKGALLSLNGEQKISVEKIVSIKDWKKLGCYLAQQILTNGGETLMKNIKENLKN